MTDEILFTPKNGLGPKQLDWCREKLTLNGQPIFAIYERQRSTRQHREPEFTGVKPGED